MSPRCPSGSDKGKKKTKPKRQPPRYIIRVPGQIPQSAPIQALSLVAVPTPHPVGVTTRSISSPSPYVVPTPHPTMVPTPLPTIIPTPPTSTPHPIVVPAPTTSTPQPSHQGPSPVMVHTSCRPSSSSNPSPDVAHAADALDSAVDDDADPPLHERPMIEPFNRG